MTTCLESALHAETHTLTRMHAHREGTRVVQSGSWTSGVEGGDGEPGGRDTSRRGAGCGLVIRPAREAETGGSLQVPGQPGLHSELKASPGHRGDPVSAS